MTNPANVCGQSTSKIRNMRGMIRRISRESFDVRPGRTLGSAGGASSFLYGVRRGRLGAADPFGGTDGAQGTVNVGKQPAVL